MSFTITGLDQGSFAEGEEGDLMDHECDDCRRWRLVTGDPTVRCPECEITEDG